jgi:hypothetical protein
MGTFAETAIVDYRLSFANQGKQNLYFPLLFAANKWKLGVSIVCLRKNGSCHISLVLFCLRKQGHMDMETWRWRPGNMETWRNGDMDMVTYRYIKRKAETKPKRFSLIGLLFAHHANISLSNIHL